MLYIFIFIYEFFCIRYFDSFSNPFTLIIHSALSFPKKHSGHRLPQYCNRLQQVRKSVIDYKFKFRKQKSETSIALTKPSFPILHFAINLSKNPILHSRTKNIEIRHHFLRYHVLKGDYVLEFVDTKNQLADLLTKPLPKDSFYTIRRELGLLDASDLDK